jgi:hypothetical protein
MGVLCARQFKSDFPSAVIIKITVFWNVRSHSFVCIYKRFRGPFCLHLQGRRVTPVEKQASDNRGGQSEVGRLWREADDITQCEPVYLWCVCNAGLTMFCSVPPPSIRTASSAVCNPQTNFTDTRIQFPFEFYLL